MSKGSLYFVAIGIIAIAAVILVISQKESDLLAGQAELRTFTSEAQVKEFLQSNAQAADYRTLGAPEIQAATAEAGTESKTSAEDYSATNIQVAGVDEADVVKNDGKYIYTISGSVVVIADAFPAEPARIVSTINLSGTNPQEIYVNGDRLAVFGGVYGYGILPLRGGIAESTESGVATGVATIGEAAAPSILPRYDQPTTYIKIYDISDRSNPELKRDAQLNGTYYDSRMIGDYVYAIVNAPPYYIGDDIVIPAFSPQQRVFPEIYYFPVPDYSYQFTNVLSVNVKDDGKEINNKVFLLGYSNSLFVSRNNIYMVYQKHVSQNYVFDRVLDEIILPAAPSEVADEIRTIRSSDKPGYQKQAEINEVVRQWLEEIGPEEAGKLQQRFEEKYNDIQTELAKELDKSVIHKISISNGDINYRTKGEVVGQPLNQFSMDEHGGYFRIATTTSFGASEPVNNVYVLDGSMNVVGRLEDLAKGERIFSARFIGDRAYLVTFVRIDPLFVIDLSDPTNPKALGELKIPGVSDYLHPYDDNHIIGIGRATEDIAGRVTFSGLKISLFDIGDVANPREVAKYEIGGRGTDSEALRDHRAFLFSKSRNLLVLPMIVYEPKEGEFYGQPTFQGAYVFNLNLENGFTLKGRVTHAGNVSSEYYYYYGPYSVTRSLYMDDNLYTISPKMIKANSLDDLAELAAVELPGFEEGPIVIY